MASWKRPPCRPRNVWLNKVQEDANALPLSTLLRSEIFRGHGALQQSTRTTRRRWWWLTLHQCIARYNENRNPNDDDDAIFTNTVQSSFKGLNILMPKQQHFLNTGSLFCRIFFLICDARNQTGVCYMGVKSIALTIKPWLLRKPYLIQQRCFHIIFIQKDLTKLPSNIFQSFLQSKYNSTFRYINVLTAIIPGGSGLAGTGMFLFWILLELRVTELTEVVCLLAWCFTALSA